MCYSRQEDVLFQVNDSVFSPFTSSPPLALQALLLSLGYRHALMLRCSIRWLFVCLLWHHSNRPCRRIRLNFRGSWKCSFGNSEMLCRNSFAEVADKPNHLPTPREVKRC